MALDPQLRVFLDRLEEDGWLPLTGSSAVKARQHYRSLSLSRRGPSYEPEPVAKVTHENIPGPAGQIRVRIYRPKQIQAAVTYLHGGGWVLGDLDTHDPLCRRAANLLQAVVIAADYRRAPEHPFPAAYDDTVAVVEWMATQYSDLRLGVAGDSAGGNLAAAAALYARSAGGPKLTGQLLLYPATDMALSLPSVVANGRDYFLTAADMRWFIGQYLPVDGLPTDPRADVLQTPRLSNVAPAVVAVAEFDPLRDEGVAYAERLDEVGALEQMFTGASLTHGYFNMGDVAEAAAAERDVVLEAFRSLLIKT